MRSQGKEKAGAQSNMCSRGNNHEFARLQERLERDSEEIPESCDDAKALAVIMKRVLRGLEKAIKIQQTDLRALIQREDAGRRRLGRWYRDMRLNEWGYPEWDDHLDPVDNIILMTKAGYADMVWGRQLVYKLQRAIEAGDDELILQIVKDEVCDHTLYLPEPLKERIDREREIEDEEG